jgi:hypothetical protein
VTQPGVYPVSGAMYWSQTEPAWMGVFIGLPDGRQYLRYELTWRHASPEDAAKDIVAFRRRVVPALGSVWAQPALWPAGDFGPSVAQVFGQGGVSLRKGNDDRINGWSRLRSWLRPRVYGLDVSPGLIVHPVCNRFIRTLPSLVASPADPDDVRDSPLAFPAHAVRFFLMGQPPPWQPLPKPEPKEGTWGFELKKFREPPSRIVVGNDLVKQ